MSYTHQGLYRRINQFPPVPKCTICSGIDVHYTPKSGVHFAPKYSKHISIESAQDKIEGDSKELEADDFAVKWTFSEEEEAAVLANGSFKEQNIIEFARKFGTHPAMIIGRFHHKKILPFSVGRKFIRPIHLDG